MVDVLYGTQYQEITALRFNRVHGWTKSKLLGMI